MQAQPQLIDHIADMSAEDLRAHLRNAYANTHALNREIEMLHGMIRRQKEQRDALLAACVSVRNWSKTHEDHVTGLSHLDNVILPVVEDAIRQTESPGTITVYDIPACNVCGVGFTPAEWKKRRDGPEDGCPRQDDPDGDAVCECDLLYHERCCPDYKDDTRESER